MKHNLPTRYAYINGKRQLVIDLPCLTYPEEDILFAEDIASMTGIAFKEMQAILAERNVPFNTYGRSKRKAYNPQDIRHHLADLL